MMESNNRTSPRRILNILEEIILDPDNFTAKKISHKLKKKCSHEKVHLYEDSNPIELPFVPKNILQSDISWRGEALENIYAED